jgi:hypothetical protein
MFEWPQRNGTLMSDYMFADGYGGDSFDLSVDGVPLTIGDGLVLNLSGGTGSSLQAFGTSIRGVKSPGKPDFLYNGSLAGIEGKNQTVNGTYKTVLFSYDFSSISNLSDRVTVMNRTIEFLRCKPVATDDEPIPSIPSSPPGDGDGGPPSLTVTHSIEVPEGEFSSDVSVIPDDDFPFTGQPDWVATGPDIFKPSAVNQPPVANPGGPYTVSEGSSIQFNGGLSHDPDGTIVSYEWDFDNDSFTDATGVTAFHTFADNGNFPVRLTVTDNLGATGTATVTVTVTNVPPSVNAGADFAVEYLHPATVNGTYSDPGIADTHTGLVNWGDGIIESFPLDTRFRTFSATHEYNVCTDMENFTASFSITDDDSGIGFDLIVITHYYPGAGGTVFGGGRLVTIEPLSEFSGSSDLDLNFFADDVFSVFSDW